jgi:fructose-1,6-bisphosphatase/inositol monophosphatase family enzyme
VGHSLDSTDPRNLLEPIRRLHELIREEVTSACALAFERSSLEKLAAVAREEEGDTIYAVDRISEELLIDFCGREIATIAPLVLIAEGLPDGKVILPDGASEESAAWRVIVDPIDGTRGLMYQKRSAWVLTGVARNRGDETSLSDIELAVQTELPLVKQHLADVVWASKGDGVEAERFNRLSSERTRIAIGRRPRQRLPMASPAFPGSFRAFETSSRRSTRRWYWEPSGRSSRAKPTALKINTHRPEGSSTSSSAATIASSRTSGL